MVIGGGSSAAEANDLAFASATTAEDGGGDLLVLPHLQCLGD